MNSRAVLRTLVCAALLMPTAGPSAAAEGSFGIPAGARFNLEKLERIDEYFRDQIINEKILGAVLLIQQHG